MSRTSLAARRRTIDLARIGLLLIAAASLASSGCHLLDPTGARTATRIPPPGTGSYAIPNGAARSSAEPYYSRSEADGTATSAAPASFGASAPGSGGNTPSTGSAGGVWQRATSPAPSGAGASTAPPSSSSVAPLAPVADANFVPWRGNGSGSDSAVRPASYDAPASNASLGAPVAPASFDATADANAVDPDEPGRIAPSGRPLPTEAGTIGSGVRTVGSTEVSAEPGRRAGAATTLPRPVSVDALLDAGSDAWRPRF